MTKDVRVDSGEKPKDRGHRRSYGEEIEKVNELSSHREQEVYILNSLDK